jgi:hypothetical protein
MPTSIPQTVHNCYSIELYLPEQDNQTQLPNRVSEGLLLSVINKLCRERCTGYIFIGRFEDLQLTDWLDFTLLPSLDKDIYNSKRLDMRTFRRYCLRLRGSPAGS